MKDIFLTSTRGSREAAEPHLVLVGLPGCGKSTVGRLLGRTLGRAFLDFDAELEAREGKSVAEIFAGRGEPYFRAREAQLTLELAVLGGMVLAPGGGWVTIPSVTALLRPPGRIIYLAVRPEAALARLGDRRHLRPLLAGSDPLPALQQLLREREPAYRAAADLVVEADDLTPEAVVQEVKRVAGVGGQG